MANGSYTAKIEVVGYERLLRVLNNIPDDLKKETDKASQEIAYLMLGESQAAAVLPVQRLAASGMRVRKSTIPAIYAGTQFVRGMHTRTTDIFFGAEFGGQGRPTTQQFPPFRGKRGYFVWPTLRANGDRYKSLWVEAMRKAMRQWYSVPSGE